jgi:hypothetical protein
MRARIGCVVAALALAGCGLVPTAGGSSDTSANLECPSADEVNKALGTQVVFDQKTEILEYERTEDQIKPDDFACEYHDPKGILPVVIRFKPDRDRAAFAAYKDARKDQHPSDIAGFHDEAFTWREDSADPTMSMREVAARRGSLIITVIGVVPAEKEAALLGQLFDQLR